MKSFKPVLLSLTFGLILGTSISIPVLTSSTLLAEEVKDIVFKPTVSGAPTRRIGGGSRGKCDPIMDVSKDFSLHVLAPDTTGLTIEEQPTLYWAISKPVNAQFSFTFGKAPTPGVMDFPERLLESTSNLSVTAGIHELPLAKHNVKLETGVEYEWAVALICDANNRSLDIIASGTIKRIDPSTGLAERIKQTNEQNIPFILAENGLWYDSVEALARLLKNAPNDKKLRQVQASLLKQGGLSGIVDSRN